MYLLVPNGEDEVFALDDDDFFVEALLMLCSSLESPQHMSCALKSSDNQMVAH
jgi:hypothetical protein